MAQTVIGIFNNASEAQDAVEQLVKKGFNRSDIDVSLNSGSSTGTTGSSDYSSSAGTTGFTGSSSTDYTSGSSTTGFGSTSSSSDDNSGESKVGKFFRNLFGGDDNDSTYSNYSKAAERGTVVTVHAKSSDEAENAADILDDYGAVDVNDSCSSYNTSSSSTGSSLTTDQTAGTTTSIPVIEEQLQVGKRTVETGGVRLRSRIVERPVEESLRLREERVYVNRNTVNRPVTGNELEGFKESTIELTETAEVPVVAKEAYVKEEVTLGKDVNEREETIRDTVRSTEVDVENIKTDNLTNTTKSSGFTGSSNTTGNL